MDSARAGAGDHRNDRLHALVTRIAAGDRAAFRAMYALLAMQVWRDAVRLLPPAHARAVTRSTFVEVWHFAGHRLDGDELEARAWVRAITTRRIEDRHRAIAGGQPLQCDYDHLVQRELVSLLGTGGADVRSPGRGR